MTARARRLALVAIVLANVFGGVSYPAQKQALAGLPPATVTLLRNAVALVLMALLVLRQTGPRAPWSRGDRWRVAALGTVAFALPMWLGIVGVERSTAANASILILLEPITIVALSCAFLGERAGALKLASLALGLAGALALVLEGAQPGDLLSGEHVVGNGILALHGVLWGCYTPIAKPLSERHDPVELSLWATVAGTLALVPFAALEAPRWRLGAELLPALAWTLALGLFVSFGGVVLWLAALREIPATSVAGFVFLQPLAGVLVGVMLLGESLSHAALLGGGLILLGVALDIVATVRRAAPAEEAS